jgi:hypothetical protein
MRRFVLPPLFLIPILLGLFLPTVSVARWDIVHQCRIPNNGTPRSASCGFFFNEYVGFIGSSMEVGIYKTTDGGKTWLLTNTPRTYFNGTKTVGYTNDVTQIVMTDALNGWACCEEQSPLAPSIFKTTDGGMNWTAVGPPGDYSCIYKTPAAVVAVTRGNYTTGQISLNGGQTYTQNNALKYMNGIDFVDNLHGVISGFVASPWLYTVDGGVTWSPTKTPKNIECWGVYGQKGTPNFYACPERDQNSAINRRQTSDIFWSSNYGVDWQLIDSVPISSTGHICGARGVLYVQADSPTSINRGIYRSTDGGFNWKAIGGPSIKKDMRFVATGCNGGVVYAFDGSGNVWKTRDGGDGAIPEPPAELEITGTSISLSGNICETTFASLGLINHYCEDDTIQLVELVDPAFELFTSGALSVVSIPPLPRALTEGQKDSILFKWEPSKLFHSDTLITTQIRLRYYSNIYQRVLDTIITITLHAIGVEPAAIVAPTALNFGPVNYCAPYDTVISIKNLGCDTLFILNGIPASTTGFTMTDLSGNPINFPIILLPGDATNFDVHFFFTLAGAYANSITFKLQHQGIRRDTVIAISASIDSKGSYVLADSLFAGIVSTCNPRDTALPLLNLGCTDIFITSATITGSSAFTLVGTPPYTSPIKPNATGRIFLNFSPPTAGIFDAVLHLQFTTLGEAKTIDIHLHGIGTTDLAFLYVPKNFDTLFDLHVTRCDSVPPFVINLSNPGCPDKVKINSVTMQPASNPDVSISWDATPKELFADTSFTITAKITPKEVGIYTGKIIINFQVGNQPPRDTIVQYFLDVKYGTRYLTLDKDTIDLGTIKFCELSDQTLVVRNPGCDSLSVFTYTYTGPNDISMSPSPKKLFATNEQTIINFHLAPVTTGRIVGSLDITSNSDTSANRTIPIIANVIPTDTVNFDLVANRQNIKVGDTVSFELMPRRTMHGKNITDIAFDINCNSDLLELLTDTKHQPRILIPNVSYTLGSPGGTPKQTTQKMTLQGQPFIEIDSGVAIATLTFLARLTDTISTTMFLDNITVNGGDPNFSKCVLGVISSEAGYTLLLECGEKTLIKYMQLGNKLTLQMLSEIIPDPITNRTSYRATIPLGVGIAGDIEVQIFDATGKLVKSEDALHAPAKGIYTITIDGGSLPSGAYRYVIKHRESNEEVSGSFRLIR